MSAILAAAVSLALNAGINTPPVIISGKASCQTCGSSRSDDANRYGAAGFDCVKEDGIPDVNGVLKRTSHCSAAHDDWIRQTTGRIPHSKVGVRVRICSEFGSRPCEQIDIKPIYDETGSTLENIRVVFTTPDTQKHDETYEEDQELFLLDGNSIDYPEGHELRVPTPTPVSDVHMQNPCPAQFVVGWTNLGGYPVEAWRTAEGQEPYDIPDVTDSEMGKAYFWIYESGVWLGHIWRYATNPLGEKFYSTEILFGPMVGTPWGECD